jgi:isopentenyl-diphosphate Delta-isomerase
MTPNTDITAEDRKRDHIELALQSQVAGIDARFYYEPILAAHPTDAAALALPFLGKTLCAPIWVSSMTGGTAFARIINQNLARACGEFGLGMGLGSCRQLLFSDEFLPDFAVRKLMGDSQPLYANLGVAQLEELIDNGQLSRINDLVAKLDADGLIIHVNPLQEWLQPEGDRFKRPPLQTITTVLNTAKYPIIVKEVGQGFGIASLRALMQLPLAAIDFAASGGTNFAKLELLRNTEATQNTFAPLAHVGHSAEEMVGFVNQLLLELGDRAQVQQYIISGGVRNFLDGYYLTEKLQTTAIYGQAAPFLTHARADYATLQAHIAAEIAGLSIAKAVLTVR